MSQAATGSSPPPQERVDADRPELELVRFDRRTRAFLGALLAFLLLATAFAIHGSSIGIWDDRLAPLGHDRRSGSGVLFGTPRWDRIDEWNIFTPAIVSQATVRPPFPVVNDRWGAGEVPLIFKFPAWHWSTLVRPQLWAFFVLDLERAYAFHWNVRAVFLLGGVFLLLMLLTRNDFWVSLLGAAWVFFSGLVQWWYSNQLLPELIGSTGLMVVAAHYVVLARRRWAVAAVVLVVCAANFALALYPPYQVPLAGLAVVVGASSLAARLRNEHGHRRLWHLARLVPVVAAVGAILFLFHRDARHGIELMRATIYPGARVVAGGDLTVARLFAGFFGFFMTAERFPAGWDNVCEASNFVLLFPIPAAVLIARAWRRQGVTAVEWGLFLYIGVLLTWTLVGWPQWLAVASGFGRSQPVRALVGLGTASILLCCLLLATSPPDDRPGLGRRLLVVACMAAALLAYGLDFERATSGFATARELTLVVLGGTVAGWLLLVRRRLAFAACVLIPQAWAYGLVNPVAVGLGPILDAPTFQQLSRLVADDPDARWIVYGDVTASTLLKMAGARVFNGMSIIPRIDELRTVDPDGTGMPVYNRYGYMVLVPTDGPEVSLTTVRNDLYEMRVDPKSDVWRALGVRYVVLPGPSTDPAFLAKTTLVRPDAWIYRFRDEVPASTRAP
jgi:hypothetical protein